MFIALRSWSASRTFGTITANLALYAVTIFLQTENIWRIILRDVLIVELSHTMTTGKQKRPFTLLKKKTINCVVMTLACTSWTIEIKLPLKICVLCCRFVSASINIHHLWINERFPVVKYCYGCRDIVSRFKSAMHCGILRARARLHKMAAMLMFPHD